jgi:hypothetical protein
MPERNTGITADNHIELRIGINLGDVIVEGDDLYGDGVNIAARIEALADAGGVFVSTVHGQVRDRLPFVFEDLGEQQVKNIARPVRVYRVSAALSTGRPGRRRPSVLYGSRTARAGHQPYGRRFVRAAWRITAAAHRTGKRTLSDDGHSRRGSKREPWQRW